MRNYNHFVSYARKQLKGNSELSFAEISRRYKEATESNLAAEQLRKILSREFKKEVKSIVGAISTPKPLSSFTISKSQRPKIVGIIGDTHEPFTHKDYRDFCNETFNKYKVDRIVHIGDEVDNHAISFHEHDPNGMSANSEADKAQEAMNKWYKAFPEVSVILGNHTALPFRQANSIGLPKRFIKTYEEAWQAPKGWKWYNELDIDHVKYAHGTGSSGQNGAINLAIRSRQSTVIGHIHAFAGVNYHANNNDLIFGMNVGCGIDVHAYAFEYAKPFINKPTLGCGIVLEGQEAIFVPMKLGRKYEWVR